MHVPDSPDRPSPTALAVRGPSAVAVTADGEATALDARAAAELLNAGTVLLCHAPFAARWLGLKPPPRRAGLYDIMELYAFVRPAAFCVPTPGGLARALGLAEPVTLEDEALTLFAAAQRLLGELAALNYPYGNGGAGVAAAMARAGWAWGPDVRDRLGAGGGNAPGLDVWSRMPEWSERGARQPRGGSRPSDAKVSARLAAILGKRTIRPGQADYAAAAAGLFGGETDTPPLVLAEAGTGIGKTLGYLAPASLWAEETGGTVWISTYTKNLQRQLDGELAHVMPEARDRARHVAVRKGRENYLCLLNFQEAAGLAGAGTMWADPVTLGLVARWAQFSRDCDMAGGDFPAWLVSDGAPNGFGLTDRRGECLYTACPHYRKCPIERAARRARTARFVIANHALVLTRAAQDAHLPEGASAEARAADPPGHIIFDEGHHLFDAADSAFATHLTGSELADLRRWIRGPEARGRLRTRGLDERLGDLLAEAPEANGLLSRALAAAARLPGPGWQARMRDGPPAGPCEAWLAAVRDHVHLRMSETRGQSEAEAPLHPPAEEFAGASGKCSKALLDLFTPLDGLARALRGRLDADDPPDAAEAGRIEALARGLERRAHGMIAAWRHMLNAVAGETPPEFVDWAALDHAFGRLSDAGLHRHYLDPMQPLARLVYGPARGVMVTSATLLDAPDTDEDGGGWEEAARRLGAASAPRGWRGVGIPSPFDYEALTRVFVVTDLARDDADAVAAALFDLFGAAGGGAIGLFTAIHRLRAAHKRLIGPLSKAGLALYAQHVDPMDTGTLIAMFREEINSCLLGTDAVRDGVDVPGRSLRLMVLDRVPWPRPDLLHKARRAHAGSRGYDDRLARLRLKQAYGRLVRRPDDRGVFVILDRRTPSRLLTGLPPGVAAERLPLAETVARCRDFLSP